MKIWLDDLREPPEGDILCHSVNEAIRMHAMNPEGRENMQRSIDRYWP